MSGVRERTGGRVPKGAVVAGLLVAAATQVVAFEAVRRVFVDTVRGQWLDAAALQGNSIGQGHIEELVDTVLNAMTVLSIAAATLAIAFIALARGRILLAGAAILLVAGANLTTQLLKYGLERPELGVDLARAGAGNSLPSGHTTVAASVAVALVLVLPPALRGAAALVGAGYAGLAGIATLSAGWHRPSDAVAAMLVVGAWAALVAVVLVITDGAERRGESGERIGDGGAGTGDPSQRHPFALSTLALGGLVLLAVGVVAMALTYRYLDTPPELLSRNRLLVAYGGGAAGIAGTAALVVGLVLASAPYAVRTRTV